MPRTIPPGPRDIAAKLRLTAALLGHASQKELCAAFRRVNPRTAFDLDRSYKWIQGRSLPRSPAVYEDWAQLLGLDRSGSWIAAAPLEAFLDLLCRDGRANQPELLRRAGLELRPTGQAGGAATAEHLLCAANAGYSPAQSPYYRGRLIRSTLAIEAGPPAGGRLVARYSQALPHGQGSVAGPVLAAGQALALHLAGGQAGEPPVSFHLHRPAPPASLLAGIMCSCVMLHPGGQPPYATRVALIRVPRPAALVEASNRYMEPGPMAVAGDLAALGLAVAEPEALEARLARFLRPEGAGWAGADQVPMADHIALGTICDRIWLDTLQAKPAAAE